MVERLAQFDLEVEPSKTVILRFGSTVLRNGPGSRGDPRTFSFLGFTHYAGRSRKGRFVVGRKSDGKRKRKKLKALNAKLRAMRGQGGKAMIAYLQRHLRGHIQYYGVSGNSRGVAGYIYLPLQVAEPPQSTALTDLEAFRTGRSAAAADCPNRPRPLSRAKVEGSSWEPDGVTLQVRFCEEPGTNRRMAEILWHRRETRRQRRTPTSA
jgi:hypothetical protein